MRDIALVRFPAPPPRQPGDQHSERGYETRPALVLTRGAVRPYLHSVTVAPTTRTVRGLQYEVRILRAYGVDADCVANLDNVTTVPDGRVVRTIGQFPESAESELLAALVYVYDLRTR